jgi:4-amino-4-deoxy-L-arabinose transferase-like glycosyltransferase
VNLLYQVLTLVFLARLAGALVGEREARALAWVLQLLPLAFAYRVRANHEQPLVMFLAAALLGLEHARRDPRWSLLTVAGLLGLLLVKGVLAAPAFLVCLAWVALRPRGRWPWLALALSAAAAIAAVAAYEAAYRAVTGESFLATYLGRQILTGHVRNPLDRLGGYAYAFVWYFARVVWFAFPWSLVALASLPRLVTDRAAGPRGGWIALATTAVYLLLFSASERRAERYLFPAYYAVAMAGALAAAGRFPRFARLVGKVDGLGPWAAPALFVLLFALHLAGGWLHLPRIKVWAPDGG